jgi:hypothetical protein
MVLTFKLAEVVSMWVAFPVFFFVVALPYYLAPLREVPKRH